MKRCGIDHFATYSAAVCCSLLLSVLFPAGCNFACGPRAKWASKPFYKVHDISVGPSFGAYEQNPKSPTMANHIAVTGLLFFVSVGVLSSNVRCRQKSRHTMRRHKGFSQLFRGQRSPICRAATDVKEAFQVPVLRLGTRGSPLALAQAHEAKRRLGETFPALAPEGAIEIKVFSTTGDQLLDVPLSEIGGKGLFTKELDAALAAKEVDFCVHSTKDVPTMLIPGTELCTMLPREDTRDALINGDGAMTRIEDFPDGSVIGTASLRRQAQIYAKNPNVKCVNFRGNVQTRLRKLQNGDVSATLLAYAGLKRMSMEKHATRVLEWDEMLPAVSQGAISFQCRSDDEKTLAYLKPLSHTITMQAVLCERAFLATLEGNCKTPIAGQAQIKGGQLHFSGLVASPDGIKIFRVERTGMPTDAEEIGRDAGLQIRSEAGIEFFEEMQAYVQDVQAANTKPVKK